SAELTWCLGSKNGLRSNAAEPAAHVSTNRRPDLQPGDVPGAAGRLALPNELSPARRAPLFRWNARGEAATVPPFDDVPNAARARLSFTANERFNPALVVRAL